MYIKRMISLFVTSIVLMCLAGCKYEYNTQIEKESMAEAVEGEATEHKKEDIGITFPQIYEKNNGKVQFNCEIEIPDDFEEGSLRRTKVKSIYSANNQKALEHFGNNREILDEQIVPAEGDIAEEHYYTFEDSSGLSTGNSTIFYTENSQHYMQVFLKLAQSEVESNDKELLFANSQECIAQLEQLMKDIGYGAELEVASFSLTADKAKEWEEHLDKDEGYDEELYKQDWSQADDAYLLYAYQTYQNLPIYHELMFLGGNMQYVNAYNAAVQAIYTAQGIIQLQIFYLYNFSVVDEFLSLAQFDEIAETVDVKLNSLLSDDNYEVKSAKLMQIVKHNQEQEYEVRPIWYFEVLTGEDKLAVLVDAVTAEEVVVR